MILLSFERHSQDRQKDEHGKLSTRMMSERKNEHQQVDHTVNYLEEIDIAYHLIGLVGNASEYD